MTQALNLDGFKKFGVTLAALACAVSLLFVQAPQAHAAGLTEVQIKAVINLLEAFEVDPDIVANVGSLLRAQQISSPVVAVPPPAAATPTTAPGTTGLTTQAPVYTKEQAASQAPKTSGYTGPHVPSQAVCMSQDPSRDNADDRYMNPDVPSVKEFMDATGAAFSDATPVLSLGRMKDLRDWKAIMASSNPLQAARDAIGALYNSGRTDYVWWQSCKIEWLPKTTILASTQNFTFYKDEYPTGIIYRVGVHDSHGYLITVPANSFVLFDNIRNFGLDKAQLSSLQAQLDAKGIDQTKISSWPRNFKDPSISVGPAINIMAAIGMTVLSPYEWAVQNLTNALFEAGLY